MYNIHTINLGTYLVEDQYTQFLKMKHHYILLEFKDESTVWVGGELHPVPAGVRMVAHLTEEVKVGNNENKGLFYRSVIFRTSVAIPEIILLLENEFQIDFFEFDHVYELQLKLAKMVESLRNKEKNIKKLDSIDVMDKINSIPIFINRYIRKNYHKQLSLIALADLIGCNPTYLSNSYSKIFQIPPMKHLQEFRLQKACNLLLNTEKKIYRIALEVGYISVSQFISYFKKRYSISPNKYRKINRLKRNDVEEMRGNN